MRTRLLQATLPMALLLAGCQVSLPSVAETRLTGGATVTAPDPTAESLPAQPPAALAADNPSSPLISEPAAAVTAPAPLVAPALAVTPAEPVEPDAPDALDALLEMRAFIGAYESHDASKVALYESVLHAAKRHVDSESVQQFAWKIERGHAEVFARATDMRITTADFTNIRLTRVDGTLTIQTKDGSPLLRAAYSLDGTPGIHEIAQIAFNRDADGHIHIAALPADGSLPLPLTTTLTPPAGTIAQAADRASALALVSELNDAYVRRDADTVAALLGSDLAARAAQADQPLPVFSAAWRVALGQDFTDPLFSVAPLALDLLTVTETNGKFVVTAPTAVITTSATTGGDGARTIAHTSITIEQVAGHWRITGTTD